VTFASPATAYWMPSGTSPQFGAHPGLRGMVETTLANELSALASAIVVPLGAANSAVPSLANTCRRWVFTVCGQMSRRPAPAPLVSSRRPAATPPARSRSGSASRPPAGAAARAGQDGHRAPATTPGPGPAQASAPARSSVPAPQPAAPRFRPAACLACIYQFASASRGLATYLPAAELATARRPSRKPKLCAEEMFCAPMVAIFLPFSRHSYSYGEWKASERGVSCRRMTADGNP
jgi:hypothetical protein